MANGVSRNAVNRKLSQKRKEEEEQRRLREQAQQEKRNQAENQTQIEPQEITPIATEIPVLDSTQSTNPNIQQVKDKLAKSFEYQRLIHGDGIPDIPRLENAPARNRDMDYSRQLEAIQKEQDRQLRETMIEQNTSRNEQRRAERDRRASAPIQSESTTMPLGESMAENNGPRISSGTVTKRDDDLMNRSLEDDIAALNEINSWTGMGVGVNPNAVSQGVTKMNLDDYYTFLESKHNLSRDEIDNLALTYRSNLNNEQSANLAEKAQKYGEEHPILGSIASLPMTLANAVEGVNNVLVGGLTGDERRLSRMASGAKQGFREGTKENIDSNAGKVAYDLGMGLGDLGVGVATGQAPAILAGNTANEATLGAVDRGQNARKAALYGAGSGVADYITNTIGLDKAKSLAMESLKSSGIRNTLAKMGIAAASEAGENVIQDIAQTFLDEVINDENSESQTELRERIASGESVEEALKNTLLSKGKNLLMSAGTGALMGAGMFGGTAAINGLRGRLGSIPRLNDNPAVSSESAEAEIPHVAPEDLARQNEIDVNEKVDNVNQAVDEINNLAEQIPGAPEAAEAIQALESANPNDVVYHAGILSRLNKSDSAGKMEGMRDTGYYGTGHYFVDSAHRNEIGRGTSYGAKPYTSVDISKYDNLFKADTDAKASDLHDLSQRMMRYINGYNNSKFMEDGEIVPELLDEYMGDMYSNYSKLFGDRAMSREAFEDWVNNARNNYRFDYDDRGDSAFTTFMKEHGYNGVDTRGTRSADTSRGVVIYDLDEDSILQSNVSDEAVKNGLMNQRVRNNNPLFDEATDARIQKDIDAYNKRKSVEQEYSRIYDSSKLGNLEKQIDSANERIRTLEGDTLPYYERILNDDDFLNNEVEDAFREYEEVGLDDVVTREELAERYRQDALSSIEEGRAELAELRNQVADLNFAYDAESQVSYDAYQQAQKNVDQSASGVPATTPPTTPPSGGGVSVNPEQPSGDKLSRYATNTMRRGTNLTPEEYAEQDLSQFMYESKTEKQSMEDAFNMIRDEGADNLKSRLMSDESQDFTQSEIDAMMSLIRTNNANIRALKFEGKIDEAKALRAETTAMNKKVRQQTSSNAQALQALAKWTRNTPEGMLMHAENVVNGNTKTEKSALQEALDKLKRNKKDFEFSAEFEDKFLEEAEKLQEIGDMDSRAAKDIMAKLGRMINDEIPVKLNEKIQAFLMDNMLGNFRTLITRNAGGNVGLNVMEQTMTRPLAAGIDRLVAKKTGRRTQAGMSKEALSEYMQGFVKGLSDEAHDLKTGLHTARTGENTLDEAIRANRHVFKTKFFDKRDSLIKNGLSVGDRPFYEATYKQTLGDYYRLRNAGVMGDDIQGLSDESFKQYADIAASLNALSAVYQNNSTMSRALLKLKDGIGDLSEGMLGFDILSQFSMPFVKTPANVVDRAIDYSPLGLIRNTVRTAKEGGIGGANFDQNRFVNETARNIIGTALMGGATAAAANGVMSGAYSDDKDKAKAQKESGMQEYALNLPNNLQMDVGWIPVLGSNAVAAAAAYNAYKDSDESGIRALAKGLSEGGQSLVNQSMFQGLQRLFGTGESYNSEGNLPENLINVVKSGLGQAIPSLMRQGAQVTDKYQRDLSGSNKKDSLGIMNNYDINSLVNNIPLLRELALNPKVNSQGELVEESQGRGFGARVFEDMFLPGKITQIKEDRLRDEAQRLSDSTGNAVAYMPRAVRSKVDTDEHTLSNKEWLDYQQKYGKEMTAAGNLVMDSEAYQAADDLTKEKMLDNVYSIVSSAINSDYNGKDIDKASQQYKEEGIDSLKEYIESNYNPYGLSKDSYNKLKDSGEDLSVYEGYGNALEEYGLTDNADNREYWKQAGADGLKAIKYYNDAFAEAGMDEAYKSDSAQQAFFDDNLDTYKEYRDYLKANNLSDSEKRWAEYSADPAAAISNWEQQAIDKDAAISTGFTDKDGNANTAAYERAVSVLGDDSTSLSQYANLQADLKSKEYTKQSDYVTYIDAIPGLDDEQKGQYILLYSGKQPTEESLGKNAYAAYKEYGYEGLYHYKALQEVKDYPSSKHPNGDGKIDKYDRIQKLYDMGLKGETYDEYNFLLGLKYS